MRILITGHTGFVGQHFVDYIRSNTDWDVHTPSLDLTNQLPTMGHFDYMVNLASISSVERSIADPTGVILSNTAICLNILEYARLNPPKLLIHLSSIEATVPRNPYAASKSAQDAIINAYRVTYGLPAISVSSHNIVGRGQAEEKFVPTLISKILSGEEVDVYTSNDQPGIRIYNPVENICSGIAWLLLHPGRLGAQYLIDGGQPMTNLEMAKEIAGLLDMPLRYRMVDNGRPGYTSVIPDRGILLSTTTWRPPVTLREGLEWVR